MSAPLSDFRFELRGIELWRGERHLLRNVSLLVKAGEMVQLVGPNGIGKTSLLRIACGLMPPESGEILCNGQSLRSDPESFNRQLAYLAHSNALKADLTAVENLRSEVALRRPISTQRCHQVLKQLGIDECANLAARSLSAGQRRRLALARIILLEAQLWILDEPTTNLDVNGVDCVESLIAAHVDAGGCALVAAHHGLLSAHPGRRQMEMAS
jgi:heme exporter protein A